ncbi:MAG: DUF2459 domain-containing protein [Verrucomicrobia bacterium]|nr:MAG: DUF2459 domain-containing protein [Verrucomicrobiota bacterium]TAE87524.1 MAG: DUF2459 domain-containing protein [Verrucomicrobiota bacterium]TAF25804.1 MAG: DUF2459 domain-containing protein [Verrucomicrobiota bacterium]TAF41592.1 MAG: DUF2459 domain-containing protein [Verrucomicrobiota bacterium]
MSLSRLLRFLLLAPLAVLASCSLHLPSPAAARQRVPMAMAREPKVETVPIYLLSDDLHTGLVFDSKWLEESGYARPAEIAESRWVAMSWGDEVAYRQSEWLSPLQVFQALFTPTPSVMECIPIDWKVERVCHHQQVFLAEVPRANGPALAAFLNGCAVKRPDGRPLTLAPSSWGEGRLIRCPKNYSYYFPRICNVWTAQSLRSCGLSIETSKALSAEGLVRQATSRENGFRKVWDPARQVATAGRL